MAKRVNIGIIGLGNIGSAVVEVLRKNRSIIAENSDLEIKIKKVCDLRRKKSPFPFTADPYAIINDPEIDIVVETIGGINPALKFILAALKNKKHVVTPNKEVIAKKMKKILTVARQNHGQVFFEAAVGGGIPIIQPLRESLVGNHITEIYGIVNGTTNYILSKMTEEGMEFSEALQRAKDKGYAEPDPSADIKGYDASYKAAILASVAFGVEVAWKDVSFQGITKITQEDIQYAKEIGYVIKLLAIARIVDKKLDIRVHPALVPRQHPLASVSDNYNAIYVKGYPVGSLMFYGQGAGGDPTSSAIIADIIKAGQLKKSRVKKLRRIKVDKIDNISNRYYLLLHTSDRFGVLAGIARAFAQKKVSIAAVVQKESIGNTVTLVILLHKVPEKNLLAALKLISKLSVVRRVCNLIRII